MTTTIASFPVVNWPKNVFAEKSQDLRPRRPRAAGAQAGQDQLLVVEPSSPDARGRQLLQRRRRGRRQRRLGPLVPAYAHFAGKKTGGKHQMDLRRKQLATI